ncbi:MAG: hypothetical protein ABIJ91_02180 [Candidatus Kuenenbacteria bacterium]
MFKFLTILFLGIILVMIELVFLPGLGSEIPGIINLPLLFFVFVSFFLDRQTIFSLAVVLGLVFDVYASIFFGFFILIFIIEFLSLEFAKNNVLQNKNLFSFLALNWLGILIWWVGHAVIFYIWIRFSALSFNMQMDAGYWLGVFYGIASHTLLILLLYLFFPMLRNRLKGDLVK